MRREVIVRMKCKRRRTTEMGLVALRSAGPTVQKANRLKMSLNL